LREVADGAALFFNPHDKEDVATVMAKIATDEKLRRNDR